MKPLNSILAAAVLALAATASAHAARTAVVIGMVLEPPHLGALIAKCAGQSPLPMPVSTGTPTTENTTESKE